MKYSIDLINVLNRYNLYILFKKLTNVFLNIKLLHHILKVK